MRLKGAGGAGANSGAAPTGQPGALPSAGAAQPQGQGAAGNGGPGGAGAGGGPRGGGDFQQMLSRLPASPLSDFQKGDAVMVVATSGQGDGPSTVITMLGGVEPVLQASSGASSILTPWSLSQGGGGGDMGTP
jgi:hypothetical protein